MPEMKHEIAVVNPTPIGCYLNKKHHVHKPLVTEFLEGAQPDHERNGLLHYEGNGSILHEVEAFTPIRKWVENCALHFADNVMGFEVGSKMHCVGSWINVASADGAQDPHQHANSFISGTYYVRKKPEHSGIGFFPMSAVTPPSQPNLVVRSRGPNAFNSPDVLNPPEGALMLWMSHVQHGYPPSGVDGRTSLSMNFLPEVIEGVYGLRLSKV